MSTPQEDLAYVRAAVDRSMIGNTHPSILYLWALITLTGFCLLDFAPQIGGLFFAIAAPLGALVSWIIGYRTARADGQADSREAWAWGLHWAGGIMGGMLLLSYIIALDIVPASSAGHLMLLIVTLSYFFAALHLDRVMAPVTVLALAALVISPRLSTLTWTIPGIAISAGMLFLGVREQRKRAHLS